MSVGIDYGSGRTNIDVKTGIRYGCISQGSVMQAWADSSEPEYGEPACPRCNGKVVSMSDYDGDEYRQYGGGCADYACTTCELTLDSSDVFGDEPQGWSLDDGEYRAVNCLDSDILILESPFYTRAAFCSPCVPGAGNLESPDEDGAKAYCFGHDWFEEGRAPYPVYRVSDNSLVEPSAKAE